MNWTEIEEGSRHDARLALICEALNLMGVREKWAIGRLMRFGESGEIEDLVMAERMLQDIARDIQLALSHLHRRIQEGDAEISATVIEQQRKELGMDDSEV